MTRSLARSLWRVLRGFRPLRSVRSAVRGRPSVVRAPGREAAPASVDDERRLLERLVVQTDGPVPTSGPLVSMIMLNRDGEPLLRRCLPAIAATDYRALELIVVDNGSSDGSLAMLETFRPPFPVRIVSNTENTSFSTGNNQGAAVATGELLLFINNDIEPIAPSWLGHLVETMETTGASAVGTRLVYPRRPGVPRAGADHPDLTLQHGGVAFGTRDGVPIGIPLGAGRDAASDWAAAVRDTPALTAACLLVRRSAFDAVDGFNVGYDYGHEDVDLCLRLRERGGRLVYDGRAALWHHESATRVTVDELPARRRRTVANRDRFVDRWAARLYRTTMLDAVAGRGFWRPEPLHVGLPVPTEDPADLEAKDAATVLEEALVGRGYRVSRPTSVDAAALARSGIDVLTVLDPSVDVRTVPATVVRLAWVTEPGAHAGADDADLVVRAPAEGAGSVFVAALTGWLNAPRIGIRIPVRSWETAETWGDMGVAQELRRAFGRLGWPTRLHFEPEWDGWPVARDDVVIDLGRDAEGRVQRGRCRVLWQTSQPDVASAELYRRYDLVVVASDERARGIRDRVDIPVIALPPGTDPDRCARTLTEAFEPLLAGTPSTIEPPEP